MLQTGAFAPIYASSQKQHAYSRLMLSSLVPLIYVPTPGGGGRASRKCTIWESTINDAP